PVRRRRRRGGATRDVRLRRATPRRSRPASTAAGVDRHRRLPGRPPADRAGRTRRGARAEGSHRDVHRHPALLRHEGPARMDRGPPRPRHRAPPLRRRARSDRPAEAPRDLDAHRRRAVSALRPQAARARQPLQEPDRRGDAALRRARAPRRRPAARDRRLPLLHLQRAARNRKLGARAPGAPRRGRQVRPRPAAGEAARAVSGPHPTPSPLARELVRGAVDYHVHVAPDFVERRITDVELARRCLETGQAGFGLKSHYCPTAERAQVVAAAVPGVTVMGAITLNRSVGGLNPLAVEIAAREGAELVWFPTVSSVNEQHEVLAADPRGKVPVWVAFELSLREAGLACEPVPVVDEGGALLPEAHAVLEVIARHDLVLCTGHLSRDEIFALVEAAADRDIRRIVVTHPEFPSQSISPADQFELAELG